MVSGKAICSSAVTCAGLVPSLLKALRFEDVPSLRCVFTWGEALQTQTATAWAQKLQLIDLLISTECWLSLYADWSDAAARGLSTPAFRHVPGTKIYLRKVPDADDEVEELLLAGPMVSPGYTEVEKNAAVWFQADGENWYGTRDCVKRSEGGFVFVGRADDMMKVGGVWVDSKVLRQSLESLPGVSEAQLVGKAAYVALKSLEPVRDIRRELPADFSLFLLPSILRHPGTGKVDRKSISSLLSLEGASHRWKAELEKKEEEKREAEVSELMGWYALLVPVLFCPLLNLVLQQGLINMLLSGLGAWTRFLTPVVAVAEVLLRLWLLSFMILSTYNQTCNALWSSWGKHFPVGSIGLMVFLAAVLPILLLLVPCAPGLRQAVGRGRLLSWPLVAAVGFPLWARSAGTWWYKQGFSGTLRWYKLQAQRAFSSRSGDTRAACGRLGGRCKTAMLPLLKMLRLTTQCATCKKSFSKSDGYVDLTVEANWYCHSCWSWYLSKPQYNKCKIWPEQGASVEGSWHCAHTSQSTPESSGSNAGQSQSSTESYKDWGNQPPPRRRELQIPLNDIPGDAPKQPSGVSKSPIWQLVERATDLSFESLSDSMDESGVSSLRWTMLESALLREAGQKSLGWFLSLLPPPLLPHAAPPTFPHRPSNRLDDPS